MTNLIRDKIVGELAFTYEKKLGIKPTQWLMDRWRMMPEERLKIEVEKYGKT